MQFSWERLFLPTFDVTSRNPVSNINLDLLHWISFIWNVYTKENLYGYFNKCNWFSVVIYSVNESRTFIHHEYSFNDDVIKWKHFPRYWPFVRGIHRSPMNYPHKGQCRGALMFSLISAWIKGWVNNREAGNLGRNHVHYDVTVMNSSVEKSALLSVHS